MEQAFVSYNGHVQGVGFRYTCRQIAKGFCVTGYVKNLADGRVELAVEGDRTEIEEYLEEIQRSHLAPFIRDRQLQWKEASLFHKDFRIEN
jgi:acylphosphatase